MQIIFFKSLHFSHSETFVETFSSPNASLNRKQNITLLLVISGTKEVNYLNYLKLKYSIFICYAQMVLCALM